MADSTQVQAEPQPGDQGRRIELHLEGDGIEPGRAPLDVLMDLAGVVQDSIYAIGRYEYDQGGPMPGRIPRVVKAGCRLELVGLGPGSAVATLELPSPATLLQGGAQLRLDLPSDEPALGIGVPDRTMDIVQLGCRAIERYGDFLAAVASKDIQQLRQVVPDTPTRNKLLRGLQRIGRWTESGVVSTLTLGGRASIRVDRSMAHTVADMVVEPRTGAVSRAGTVVLVQVDPSRYFDLAVNGQRIRCRYAPELDQAVIEGIGQVVEVDGQGTFEGKEEPSEIAVDNVEPLDLAPVLLERVDTEKGTFHFNQPLRFDVSYGDGLLIAENSDFRTLSYGRNRQELMEDIAADIEELWRAYVEESPSRLTEGALALRRRLQERMRLMREE